MARTMPLDHNPSYRAVILLRFKPDMPDHWDRTVKTYTDAEGKEYQYHKGIAYGPYSTPGSAKAAATRESNDTLNWHSTAQYIAEIDSFVEQTSADWTLRP